MNISFQMAAVLVMLSARTSLPISTHPKVREVRLHAYSLSSSTLIGIDTVQIQYSAPLKVKLKSPARFVTQLEQAISTRSTISASAFKSDFVRFWFQVSYDNGTVRSIYIAQGSTLLMGHQLYKLDNGLKELIREYIPAKDEYLPIRSRK